MPCPETDEWINIAELALWPKPYYFTLWPKLSDAYFLIGALLLRASFIRSALSILQKMATEELVTEQFQFLGIEVSKEVLSKCK